MNKYCSKCGNELTEGTVYCPKCGNNTTVVRSASQPTNSVAIAGFVCSVLGIHLVGLILSIVGLNEAKKLNDNGKGFAIAGTIISGVGVFIAFVWMVMFFMSLIAGIAYTFNAY